MKAQIPFQLNNERFIKVGKDKRPIQETWSIKDSSTFEELNDYDGNIGVLGGYNNLLIIDFDNDIFYRHIQNRLPDTFTVLSGTKRFPHLYYRIDENFSKTKILDMTGQFSSKIKSTLVDLICTGGYAVCPPSTNYTIKNDVPIAKISKSQITEIFKEFLDTNLTQKTKTQKLPDEFLDPQILEIKNNIKLSTIFRLFNHEPNEKNQIKCPFHNDTNPSLSINDKKGLFHCFGCEVSGDVITAYQLLKNIDFKQAKSELYNLYKPQKNPDDLKSSFIKGDLYNINIFDLSNKEIPPVNYLVDKFMMERGITIIGGEPGGGKSLMALQMALCIASGKHFLDKEVKKGKVFYVDEENDESLIKNRVLRISKALNINLEEIKNNIRLFNFNDLVISPQSTMRNTIYDLVDYIETEKPQVLIFDSLVRFFIGDENSSNETKMLFSILKPLITKYNLSVLMLHHHKKGTTGGMSDLRGSTELSAMVGIIINTKKINQDDIIVHQPKNRYEKAFDGFKVKIVEPDNTKLVLSYNGVADGKSRGDKTEEVIFDMLLKHIYDLKSLILTKKDLTNFLYDNKVNRAYATRAIKQLVDMDFASEISKHNLRINLDLIKNELENIKEVEY